MKDSGSEYFELCVRLAAEIEGVHRNSKRYTKRALWSILFVPLVLLLAIFITGTSKITMVFLWLTYMFLACAFLVFVEYTDHRLRERVTEILGGGEKEAEIRKRIAEYERERAEEEERRRLEAEAAEEAEDDAEALPADDTNESTASAADALSDTDKAADITAEDIAYAADAADTADIADTSGTASDTDISAESVSETDNADTPDDENGKEMSE